MPAATSGSPIATSTDATTPPMPDANATKPAFGLTAKIFVASTLLVVAVLGVTFRVPSPPVDRTARRQCAERRSNQRRLARRRAGDDVPRRRDAATRPADGGTAWRTRRHVSNRRLARRRDQAGHELRRRVLRARYAR